MRLKYSLIVVALLLVCHAMAQGRSAELKERTKQLSVMLRIKPPEATLRRVDSLLQLPAHAADPYWRQDLIHFRGHALRLLGRLDGAMEEQIRAYQLADSLQDRDGVANALLALTAIYMDLNDVERAERQVRLIELLAQSGTIGAHAGFGDCFVDADVDGVGLESLG